MKFGLLKKASGNDKKGHDKDKHSEDELEGQIKFADEDSYPRLEKALGYKFSNYEGLKRALTHRSAHFAGNKHDYERLEFLGDAVLDLVVADLLLTQHSKAKEGELSKMRAALVNTQSLAQIARRLKLGDYIILSRGEYANGGADRPSILADVFEAVMGAIYRDGGYEKAMQCISAFFGDQITTVVPSDPKTELQERLHSLNAPAPVYLLECVEGPEHAPTFVTVVEIDKEILGRGRGSTKKAAQQAAADEALKALDDK